ncbi:hypothetical protein HanRHA438_Chr10g0471871 [Helianthus annuus]|nr:hypothetical protein HanHA300_Chr10g0377181 [Helianthus annuus]KAJ0523514.1 hypothetical protein HanIR_Chr10g0494671 [Helianthus annuus]KAJ0531305.1 hypothetical protein HanHA89_Chr10g0399651 [Helianthus annuus]KAJ0634935.1 hypothetical protein HanOQP8_Chr17g0645401 [Helianthus annuus]KAJ0659738.1 hypothetical protein HanOQP8_Chr14g0529611 [Helianthus annuus]
MFRADHSDASYGSASVLSRSPRYSDMERYNKHPKGGSHLSDVIVTGRCIFYTTLNLHCYLNF